MHFKSLPLHLFTFVCACTKLFICKIGFTIYLSVIIFSNKISWWPFCKISHFILKSAWCSRAIFNEFAESIYISDQIRSVAQSCPTLCDPMNRSTPGLPVPHQLPEFTQTHVHSSPKQEKEYVKAAYCHPAFLTYMQSTSWEMPG